jgi:Flp pilus assembly protein TadG/Mg-chelatase subunit ChlD
MPRSAPNQFPTELIPPSTAEKADITWQQRGESNMSRDEQKLAGTARHRWQKRQGVIVVLTAFLLTAIFAFVALSVDTGRVVLTETEMQNACDAASLAASQEIQAAVYAAGQGVGSASIDANSIAVQAARDMAVQVAQANGVYINPQTDVEFGKRIYNPAGGNWSVQWGGTPYNVVRVSARRNGSDISAPDGEFPLAFGWAIGKDSVPLVTSSTAFTEARDLVLVLDFSGSMNYDSQLTSSLGLTTAEELLDEIWDSLVEANPTWPGTSTAKFPSTGFGNVNSYAGTYVSSTDTTTILNTLNLKANNSDGTRKYPYPQAGRGSDGLPKNKPSNTTSDSLWTKYVEFVKNHPVTSYKKKYGYRTLMDFLQQKTISSFTPRARNNSEDLWRTPQRPMEALKKGTSLFLDFLEELDFGDEVGLVGYGEWAEPIDSINDGDAFVDISSDPITPNFSQIDTLQLHHQAGEFNGQTNMGDGILKGREMLVGADGDPEDEGYSRYGARPTIILMTDGLANIKPSGWSMPAGFNWADWTDFDGNGTADYSTSDSYKKYAFWQATEAIKRGITIHTLAVGNDADNDMLEAIAKASGGVYMEIPGGTSVEEMEEQLMDAFSMVAAQVPPAQLLYDE